MSTDTLGRLLREFRESKGLLLRQVSADLEMDTALLSKFERNERKLKKGQVIAFAKYYRVNEKDLLLAWLSDKIVEEVRHEAIAGEAIKLAGEKVNVLKRNEC